MHDARLRKFEVLMPDPPRREAWQVYEVESFKPSAYRQRRASLEMVGMYSTMAEIKGMLERSVGPGERARVQFVDAAGTTKGSRVRDLAFSAR